MKRPLHVALLQTRPRPTFDAALAEATDLVHAASAAGASWLLLPEYCGGLATAGARLTPPFAREREHPVLQGLLALARDRGVWLSVGSIAVPAADGRIMNRGFLIDDGGEIVARYDKVHLFDVNLSADEVYVESAVVSPGTAVVLARTPFGSVGHSICYDLRFPNLYRTLARAGAEFLCVPAAFTKLTGEAHWHVLNRARAIENGCFVLAPCAVGEIDGGGESYGHSLIVDPWGKILADGGAERGIVDVVIDVDAVAAARRRIPSLGHERSFTLETVDAVGTDDRTSGHFRPMIS